jgi:hypothetical protein
MAITLGRHPHQQRASAKLPQELDKRKRHTKLVTGVAWPAVSRRVPGSRATAHVPWLSPPFELAAAAAGTPELAVLTREDVQAPNAGPSRIIMDATLAFGVSVWMEPAVRWVNAKCGTGPYF